ncbi:PREDICTED: inner centromere protein-like isoform X2 [Vollenhovia emeryi]|uniref:inner centromere protein-like isoform X2 n=1 Tax=Vollenhovia emeryi TaxID=411798 RepID=UPI0005F406E9|nr:PREDICTED: inner centromere protein-like isoform X2 [Vollenhovia emeryi]
MSAQPKDEIRDIVLKDLQLIQNRRVELSKRLAEDFDGTMCYVRDLFEQLSQPSSGPFVPKTPKVLRKKAVQRIETIPEDEVYNQENVISSTSLLQSVKEEEEKESDVTGGRAKRQASKRAADNIKKQSFASPDEVLEKKAKRESQVKRKKSMSSSDEDNDSKVEDSSAGAKEPARRVTRKKSKLTAQFAVPADKAKESKKARKDDSAVSLAVQCSSRTSSNTASFKSSSSGQDKVDAIVAPVADEVEELSMYEDAIGKPVPIMNSTQNISPLVHKPLNITVVLERLPQQPKLNETVVIQGTAGTRNSRSSKSGGARKQSQDDKRSYKAPAQHDDCNGLITDDESSPEVKRPKKQLGKKQINKKAKARVLQSSSEDEIPNTPNTMMKTRIRDAIAPAQAQEGKATYKSGALFSPYAKESVKKRVEAFEQAVMHSPRPVDVESPVRVTRTKTRAMAANAETEVEAKNAEKTVAQILARKSLVKAKKISLARQKKKIDERKENKEPLPERINTLLAQSDKPDAKQTQQLKTTPLSKLKLMQPILSVSRLQTPSNTQTLLNHSKATVPRANVITGMESFIQPLKSATKINSVDRVEEKRRQEEDAKKKREETLRLLTEEKRRKRQEKELKNKLAREVKEKEELEKRRKAEKEKEAKARVALMMQEKQREELEKKRLAALQRTQEKEERRKLEEQQRLLRLQEQEETERTLAEQRRREQEAEKRREAEARAQQATATAEALKQKNQLLAAQVKHKQQINNKYQGAVTYVLDSEPDDDDSDDESRPKHEIPHWAQAHVRKAQLTMQQYIPEAIIYKFFDTRKCTPDLTEMFHGIDRSRLKRTSSAIWKTPPRISMMEAELVLPKLP